MPSELKGVGEMRKALRKFTPDLNKALTKEMGIFLRPVASKARGFIPADPLSNWVNAKAGNRWEPYDATGVKRGIGYKTSAGRPNDKGFKSLAEIYNKTQAGAIFDIAGRKNPSGINKAGAYFISRMEAYSQMVGTEKLRGRAIFRAYKEDAGKAQGAVIKAYRAARDRFTGKAFF